MANVSFANLNQGFSLFSGDYVTYSGGAGYFRGTTNHSWFTPNGPNDVEFYGTGFTYNAASPFAPTGGTVDSFYLDLGSNNANTPEVAITGLSFNLALLAPIAAGGLTADQQNNLIWQTLLSGDDTIDLGTGANSAGRYMVFAGDGRNVYPNVAIYGGNDTITGTAGPNPLTSSSEISGDVLRVESNGAVYGGNDRITLTNAYFVYGDAAYSYGTVVGGNDTITTLTPGGIPIGDAYTVYIGGALFGGADVIRLTGTGGSAYGDAASNTGSVQGGNDTIYGGDGGNYLYGDVGTNSGNLRGGDDLLYGMGGDDTIYGDWASNSGTARGGNDTIYGGSGADHIYGNGGNDFIRGDAGADTIDGGDGFDTASYQFGTGANINAATGVVADGEGTTDTVSNVEQFVGSAYYRDAFVDAAGVQYFAGLGGNDYVIASGGGADVFNGGDGFDTISFYNRNAAIVNLAAGTAVVDGTTTTMVQFEEVYGSNTFGDTIVGDTGNNTLWGFGGADTLVGGRGLDTLNGGLGYDIFGFNASDLQAGVWDVISDFHEVANTDFDRLYFNGVAQNQLIFGNANGGVYVSTVALGGNGGVFIANFTAAQLSDQLLFS